MPENSYPTVTIIIPCYNYAQYLPSCLESVLAQTYQHWECIVVNDGSTDTSATVVEEFSARDPRIRLVSQANQGLSASRNKGLSLSTGKYIQLLDADDLLGAEKLQHQVEYLESNKDYALVYGPTASFYIEGKSFPLAYPEISGGVEEILPRLIVNNVFLVSSPIFKKSVVESIGGFDTSLDSFEDWDFWLRFLLSGKKFKWLPSEEPVTLIRDHGNNMSRNMKRMANARKKTRDKIDSQLAEALTVTPDNSALTAAIRENSIQRELEKGLYQVCFENPIPGLYVSIRTEIRARRPIRHLRLCLFCLKLRLLGKI